MVQDILQLSDNELSIRWAACTPAWKYKTRSSRYFGPSSGNGWEITWGSEARLFSFIWYTNTPPYFSGQRGTIAQPSPKEYWCGVDLTSWCVEPSSSACFLPPRVISYCCSSIFRWILLFRLSGLCWRYPLHGPLAPVCTLSQISYFTGNYTVLCRYLRLLLKNCFLSYYAPINCTQW